MPRLSDTEADAFCADPFETDAWQRELRQAMDRLAASATTAAGSVVRCRRDVAGLRLSAAPRCGVARGSGRPVMHSELQGVCVWSDPSPVVPIVVAGTHVTGFFAVSQGHGQPHSDVHS